jgi:hypothetical protein
MMVWDDRSSMSIIGSSLVPMLAKGLMKTHDEVTRAWFAANAPDVQCQLVGRSGDAGQSLLEGQTAASFFSHHQVRASALCLTTRAC